MKHILSIITLFLLLFQGVFAADVITNVGKVQSTSGYTGTIPSGGESKGFIGQILSDIFDPVGKILSNYILAFQNILNSDNNIPKWNATSNVFNEGSMYDVSGNIGIGISIPQTTLHVNGVGRFDGGLEVDGNQIITPSGNGVAAYSPDADRYGFFKIWNGNGEEGAYFGYGNGEDRVNLALRGDANKLIISGGNVGIGTSNPSNKLEVAGKIEADEYCDRDGLNCTNAGSMGGVILGSTVIPGGYPATTSCFGNRTLTTNGTPENVGGKWQLIYYYSSNNCQNSWSRRVYDGTTWGSCSSGSNDQCRCFVPDTQVLLTNGLTSKIIDIKVGDKVQGKNGSINTVLGIDISDLGTRKLYGFNGGKGFITSEHPLMTTDGWKSIDIEALRADDASLIDKLKPTYLQIGDEIIRQDGTILVIKSIDEYESDIPKVYNLKLDGDGIYFADGLMTHHKY